MVTTFRRKNRSSRNLPSSDVLLQISVRGGDQAHIDFDRARPPDAFELAILDHVQQFRLSCQRHLTDLVQKQGAAVGDLEAPFMGLDCPRKGTAFVTEELALDHSLRQRGAIQRRRKGHPGASCSDGSFAPPRPCQSPFLP